MLRSWKNSFWFSGVQWLCAGVPGAFFLFVLSVAASLGWRGPLEIFWLVPWLQAIYGLGWFGLGFISEKSSLQIWSAHEEKVLERSWIRAFEEVSRPVPSIPRFWISSEIAPFFVFWCTSSGKKVLILSRSWLDAHSESQIREAFRQSAVLLSSGSLRWEVAKARFFLLTLSRLPRGVLGVLFGERTPGRSSPLDWVLSLPVLSWVFWVAKWAPRGRKTTVALVPHFRADLSPSHPARRAATLVVTAQPSAFQKSILSSALQN